MDEDIIIANFCSNSKYKIIRKYKTKPYVLFEWKSLGKYKGLLNIENKIAFCWNKDKLYVTHKMWEKLDKNNNYSWYDFWKEIGNSHYLYKEKSLKGILREIKLSQI